MEFIKAIFQAFAAGAAGFIGHIVAHDFCEHTPRMAKWIIALAVRILPPILRERYEEEWLSDLVEHQGVCSKFWHAAGCLRGARKMRRQEFRSTKLRVGFQLPALGRVTIETDLHEIGILLSLSNISDKTNVTKKVFSAILVGLFFRRIYVQARDINGATPKTFVQFCTECSKKHMMPKFVELCRGEERLDLLALLREGARVLMNALSAFSKGLRPITSATAMLDTSKIDRPSQ